jgi:hypothetical protein
MNTLKKVTFIAVSALLLAFAAQIAYAAGPNNGNNNPGVCKSSTNPKCNVASGS